MSGPAPVSIHHESSLKFLAAEFAVAILVDVSGSKRQAGCFGQLSLVGKSIAILVELFQDRARETGRIPIGDSQRTGLLLLQPAISVITKLLAIT